MIRSGEINRQSRIERDVSVRPPTRGIGKTGTVETVNHRRLNHSPMREHIDNSWIARNRELDSGRSQLPSIWRNYPTVPATPSLIPIAKRPQNSFVFTPAAMCGNIPQLPALNPCRGDQDSLADNNINSLSFINNPYRADNKSLDANELVPIHNGASFNNQRQPAMSNTMGTETERRHRPASVMRKRLQSHNGTERPSSRLFQTTAVALRAQGTSISKPLRGSIFGNILRPPSLPHLTAPAQRSSSILLHPHRYENPRFPRVASPQNRPETSSLNMSSSQPSFGPVRRAVRTSRGITPAAPRNRQRLVR
jgi:hypothetical protein